MTDRDLGYAIVGYGLMGAEHARNLQLLTDRGQRVRLTAVVDPEPRSLEQARRDCGDHIATHATIQELLEAGDTDVVVVSSPNFTHRSVLDELWGYPLHLLIEKPLCTTVEDCLHTSLQARTHPGTVWVGMEYRYMPPVARLIDEVRAGVIGAPRMVAIREHRFPFLPKIGDWNRFNRNTGGTLVEKCCHFFDLMVQITGQQPRRVFASGAQDVNHLNERYDGATPDILDNAFVIVDFDDGVRGLLDLCMFAEASEHEQEIAVTGALGKIECLLPQSIVRIGRRDFDPKGRRDFDPQGRRDLDPQGRPDSDRGQALPRAMRRDRVETVELPVERELLEAGHHHGSTYYQHLRLLEAVRGTGTVEVTVDDGTLAVRIGVAAHRSILEGRPIDLSEAN